MFSIPKRVRVVGAAAVALAVIAGVGVTVANTSQAADSRWSTSQTKTGDVTQAYYATGAITRKNTAEASFSVSGTVKSVKVAVGDTVSAGQVLATLDTSSLELAVLNAETDLAKANATLYAAKHPSSTSSSKSGGSSSGGSSSGGSAGGGSGKTTVSVDPTVLNELTAAVNTAVLDESDKCTKIFDTILPAAEATATATTSTDTSAVTSTPVASATPAATATATATASSSPASSSEKESTQAEPSSSASATATASGLADTDYTPTKDDLQSCANARAAVLVANSDLQTWVGTVTAAAAGGGSHSSGSAAAKSSSSSSSSTVSKSAVASAKADVLQAQQSVASAQSDLDSADLVAPIDGTVGVVGLTAGSSSSGSITIVGSGSAVLTFELPLTTRELVKTGQKVTVTPAGSTKTLTGTLTAIASLETSGTSGDTPTYSTTATVSDPTGLLASGANASVAIPVKSATGVVVAPASAVTPTGTGTATVQVLASAGATTPSTVEVKTGAVGGGWVQITSGLTSGQIVVLADRTAAIPSNTTNRGRTSSSSSSSSSSAKASASASTSAQPQPTATASK